MGIKAAQQPDERFKRKGGGMSMGIQADKPHPGVKLALLGQALYYRRMQNAMMDCEVNS